MPRWKLLDSHTVLDQALTDLDEADRIAFGDLLESMLEHGPTPDHGGNVPALPLKEPARGRWTVRFGVHGDCMLVFRVYADHPRLKLLHLLQGV